METSNSHTLTLSLLFTWKEEHGEGTRIQYLVLGGRFKKKWNIISLKFEFSHVILKLSFLFYILHKNSYYNSNIDS